MKPLRNLIIVRIDDKPQTTKGGLYIKEKWENPQNTGEIQAVGPQVELVKKGDKIMFNRYAVIDTDEPDIKFIKEGDILGTL